jgi:hypothetical protein
VRGGQLRETITAGCEQGDLPNCPLIEALYSGRDREDICKVADPLG